MESANYLDIKIICARNRNNRIIHERLRKKIAIRNSWRKGKLVNLLRLLMKMTLDKVA